MDCQYLKQRLGKCLVEALAEVLEQRPMDPIEFVAHYIYKYKENMDYAERKAAHDRQVEEEVKKAIEEAEHQKRLKDEEERIRAAQEDSEGSKPPAPPADGEVSESTDDTAGLPEEAASETQLSQSEVKEKDSEGLKPHDEENVMANPEELDTETQAGPSQTEEEDSAGSKPPDMDTAGTVPLDDSEVNPEEPSGSEPIQKLEEEEEQAGDDASQTLIQSAEEESINPEASPVLQDDAENQSEAPTESDAPNPEEPETLSDTSALKDTEEEKED